MGGYMKVNCSKNRNEGFTLVELIIVIAIIAVLAALIAPNIVKYIDKARASRATEEARVIVSAVQNALASGAGNELDVVLDKTYVDAAGVSHPCGVITNYSLSKAQNNVVVNQGDSGYSNYVLAQDILEELHSASGSDYKFYRFNGTQNNPLGANCEQFQAQYGCPGIVVAYDSTGHVFFLEYYNFGSLIRYEDGTFITCDDETNFSGAEKIIY